MWKVLSRQQGSHSKFLYESFWSWIRMLKTCLFISTSWSSASLSSFWVASSSSAIDSLLSFRLCFEFSWSERESGVEGPSYFGSALKFIEKIAGFRILGKKNYFWRKKIEKFSVNPIAQFRIFRIDLLKKWLWIWWKWKTNRVIEVSSFEILIFFDFLLKNMMFWKITILYSVEYYE